MVDDSTQGRLSGSRAAFADTPAATDAPDEIRCPHCGGANTRQTAEGAILDCRHCDHSFAQPRPPALVRAGAASGSAEGPLPARSPADVGLRLTSAVAALLTVFFYLAVVTPLSGSYVGDLFGARGWVPYVIAWLSAWAGVLLGVKAWLLAAQRRALTLDLLPESIALRITPRNADAFRRHLLDVAAHELPARGVRAAAGLPLATTRSFLVERLDRALERFRMRGDAQDVVEQLAGQAQLDANAVESSYTMVRVFIWAIPLLGFVGTVVGISAAVAGFSDTVAVAVDLDVMKQSIGTVTTGLGVAFDTTLLALVMSIAIMFPASSLQKAEEDFLSRVEAYCDERLGRRLADGSHPAPETRPLEEQIAQLTRAISALHSALEPKLGAGRDPNPQH